MLFSWLQAERTEMDMTAAAIMVAESFSFCCFTVILLELTGHRYEKPDRELGFLDFVTIS